MVVRALEACGQLADTYTPMVFRKLLNLDRSVEPVQLETRHMLRNELRKVPIYFKM